MGPLLPIINLSNLGMVSVFGQCNGHTSFPYLPLEKFGSCPPDNQILITIWPEPVSTYFMDCVKQFSGRYFIMIGFPGYTSMRSMYTV